MPFIRVYIHFVCSTKDRLPILNTLELRQKLWDHIRENATKKDIFIDYVNGYEDHCHCLVSLGVDQTIKMIMQLIKGEAAFWFNRQAFTKHKLEWQDEYFAVSVSESKIDAVRNYIKNQEQHHQRKTFQDEYDEFISKYGFKKFKEDG